MKLSQEQIDTINTNLITLMADVEHQLICIEGELDYEKEDTNRLSDMWDCNDSGNWEAMLNSLQRIKELFNKPTGGSMAKKATSKKKVASKKTTKKAAPKKATKKASSKKVAKRKPVRVKKESNS
jgi:hypothetical protein